ncbi:SGNH/GDSL hydrolase family protein [Bacillus massilinigeriensis]|uniref:SGNH/GDSL hydrolase family protein n=1 Tax=Bacillus mediterraneensis TaxID=1805474 RepID=UPI0008F8341D|nr:SGNH/GDSL hydrolase family protein [Bacillus mediterraneensis]
MKKFVKICIVLLVLGGIASALWLYLPYYQISSLKNKTMGQPEEGSPSHITYLKESGIDTIHMLALGDSVITGFGTDPKANFVQSFSAGLSEQTGKEVFLRNEGINGLTSKKLYDIVQRGRLDEEIKQSEVIILNVGGNDILRAARHSDFATAIGTFDTLQSEFVDNMTGVSDIILTLNPQVTIVLLELYNPLPIDHTFYSLSDKLLPKWNLRLYQFAQNFNHSVVVQTTKVINSSHPDHLSVDRVHPSQDGHIAISQQALEQFAKEKHSKSN